MARGPKRHLKRLNAPKHWMLDKLGGVWAPRPSTGPHKLRECLPLIILLRNRLKYALNTKEVKYILMQRLVKVDGKARTDKTYPSGFMGEHDGAHQTLSAAEHTRGGVRRGGGGRALHLYRMDATHYAGSSVAAWSPIRRAAEREERRMGCPLPAPELRLLRPTLLWGAA